MFPMFLFGLVPSAVKRPLSLGSLHDRDEADTGVAPNTHFGGLRRLTNIPKIGIRKTADKGVKKAFLHLRMVNSLGLVSMMPKETSL